jgi:methylthioribose-1-phosphate isomerase
MDEARGKEDGYHKLERPVFVFQNSSSKIMVLQAIKYAPGVLEILDQLKLPHTEVYDAIKNSEDAWHAIKEMRTRGAPAIAIVAALALAVELHELSQNGKLSDNGEEVSLFIAEKLDFLVTSRPTAVNLADAARKLRKVVDQAANEPGSASGIAVKEAYVKAAEQMLIDDVSDNKAIGEHGAAWILKNATTSKSAQVNMLTHCNTGYGEAVPAASIMAAC